MKSILFFLALCFSTFAVAADQSTCFCDRESGICVAIPAGLKRTWNVNNVQNGVNITVFNSDENLDEISVAIVAQIPLSLLQECGCSKEECLDLVMDQINVVPFEFETNEEEFQLYAGLQSDICCEEFCSKRLRVNFHAYEEGEDDSMNADLHLFFDDKYAYTIVTAMSPAATDDELQAFSETVVQSVTFFKDEEEMIGQEVL